MRKNNLRLGYSVDIMVKMKIEESKLEYIII